MDTQLLTVVVTAAVSVATTLVAVFYGPTWKDRVDARRASQRRSEQLLSQYSEPLARAAFDLQSRLYNICRQQFLVGSNLPKEYRKLSTLWLFGQFLAWVEIVRREVQVIDFGDVRRTAELQRHLFDVADILATQTIDDGTFRVFRADQRAVGELMVTERVAGDQRRSDSLGYAEFVHRLETAAGFARWFSGLDAVIEGLINGRPTGVRAVLIQRSLIDVIDFLDPVRVRFPDPNERGRIPLPPGHHDRKRVRPVSEIARFRFDLDPWPVIESWASRRALTITADAGAAVRIALPKGRGTVGHDIVALHTAPWVELHLVRRAARVDHEAGRYRAPDRRLTVREINTINDLLRLFDRPILLLERQGLRTYLSR